MLHDPFWCSLVFCSVVSLFCTFCSNEYVNRCSGCYRVGTSNSILEIGYWVYWQTAWAVRVSIGFAVFTDVEYQVCQSAWIIHSVTILCKDG